MDRLRLCKKKYAKVCYKQACENTVNVYIFSSVNARTQVNHYPHPAGLLPLIFFSLFLSPSSSHAVVTESDSDTQFLLIQNCPANDTDDAAPKVARRDSKSTNFFVRVNDFDLTNIFLNIDNSTREETQNEHGKLPKG